PPITTLLPPPPSTAARRSPSSTPTTAVSSSWTGTPKSTKSSRRKSKKLVATPSRTLEVDEIPSPDSEGEDPLLLKGAEEMRGFGEGNPKDSGYKRRKSSTGGRSASAKGKGKRRVEEEEQEQEGEGDASMISNRSASVEDDTFVYSGAAQRRVKGMRIEDEEHDLYPVHDWEDNTHTNLAALGSGDLSAEIGDVFRAQHDDESEDLGGHDEFLWGDGNDGFASDSGGEGESAEERGKGNGSSPYREVTRDFVVPIAPLTSSPGGGGRERYPGSPVRSSSIALDFPGGWNNSPVVRDSTPKLEEEEEERQDSTIIFDLHEPDTANNSKSNSDSESEPEDTLILAGLSPMPILLPLPRQQSRQRSFSPATSHSAQIRTSSPVIHSSPPPRSISPPSNAQDTVVASSSPPRNTQDTVMTSPEILRGKLGDDVRMASPSPRRREPTPSGSGMKHPESGEEGEWAEV
ncbi:hypothetical protein P7C70_g9464, partial [Phenoliferia sp. Uapishka_3]